MLQALVPIDTPLSIICKHIPRQSDIDKIVKNIETCYPQFRVTDPGTGSRKSVSTFHPFS